MLYAHEHVVHIHVHVHGCHCYIYSFILCSSTGKSYNISFSIQEVGEIISFIRVIPSIEFVLKERKVRDNIHLLSLSPLLSVLHKFSFYSIVLQ